MVVGLAVLGALALEVDLIARFVDLLPLQLTDLVPTGGGQHQELDR